MYIEVQILVIGNNHEYNVLLNDKVKCVENQGKNSECMHVKCKYVVTIVLNILQESNFTSTKLQLVQPVHCCSRHINIVSYKCHLQPKN